MRVPDVREKREQQPHAEGDKEGAAVKSRDSSVERVGKGDHPKCGQHLDRSDDVVATNLDPGRTHSLSGLASCFLFYNIAYRRQP